MDILPPLLAAITKDIRCKQITKNQVILYEGDSTSEVYLLKNGIIKIYDIDDQGNEKILHLLKPPAVIPFVFFSGSSDPTRWFYTALTDCELYVFPREELLGKLRADNALMLYLMNWFSQEMHELLTRLSSLGKTTARDKLIAALKFLAIWHSEIRRGGWRLVTFPVNHQLLADMVGITRESAALTMKDLQNELMVRNPRLTTLEIHLPRVTKS